MLDRDEVLRRAIRWYALAVYAEIVDIGEKRAVSIYSKASAYIAVLNLPHSRQCGAECVENLQSYARKIAEAYGGEPSNIGEYMDATVNLTEWCK